MGKPEKKLDVASPEWAKHQRPYAKRKFAKKVRKQAKKELSLTNSWWDDNPINRQRHPLPRR